MLLLTQQGNNPSKLDSQTFHSAYPQNADVKGIIPLNILSRIKHSVRSPDVLFYPVEIFQKEIFALIKMNNWIILLHR